MAEWEARVKGIFERYGIPEYIWRPIMQSESGGNPNSHNTNGEDSRGLFQINMGAPGTELNASRTARYGQYNLFDPGVNAEIAAKDFIAPAFSQALSKSILDPQDQAAYTWRYGIKPYWTDDKDKSIRKKVADFLGLTDSGGSSSPLPDGGGGVTQEPDPEGEGEGSSFFGLSLPEGIADRIILVVVGIIILGAAVMGLYKS